MKRLLALWMVVILLAGCSNENKELNGVMQLRNTLQKSNGCGFSAKITADYGDDLYTFEMDCSVDERGKLSFTVTQPQTIAGITGTVDASGGAITFDDKVLSFPMLADDQITPVSAPWLAIKTLRSGYITAAGEDGTDIHTVINDSYEEQSLQLDFWLSENFLPKYCEILWQGSRVLSLEVDNFVFL